MAIGSTRLCVPSIFPNTNEQSVFLASLSGMRLTRKEHKKLNVFKQPEVLLSREDVVERTPKFKNKQRVLASYQYGNIRFPGFVRRVHPDGLRYDIQYDDGDSRYACPEYEIEGDGPRRQFHEDIALFKKKPKSIFYNHPGEWHLFTSCVMSEANKIADSIFKYCRTKEVLLSNWIHTKMEAHSDDAIEEGVRRSEKLLVILSQSYFKDQRCIKELEWAVKYETPIIVAIDSSLSFDHQELLEACPRHLENLKTFQCFEIDPYMPDRGIMNIFSTAPKTLCVGSAAESLNHVQTKAFLVPTRKYLVKTPLVVRGQQVYGEGQRVYARWKQTYDQEDKTARASYSISTATTTQKLTNIDSRNHAGIMTESTASGSHIRESVELETQTDESLGIVRRFDDSNLLKQIRDAIFSCRTWRGQTFRTSKQLFQHLDTNNSGFLNFRDMKEGLRRLDVGLTEEQLALLIEHMHGEKSQTLTEISFEEFAKALRYDSVLARKHHRSPVAVDAGMPTKPHTQAHETSSVKISAVAETENHGHVGIGDQLQLNRGEVRRIFHAFSDGSDKTHGVMYPGQVYRMCTDGTYDIVFDDGSARYQCPKSEIEPTGPSSCFTVHQKVLAGFKQGGEKYAGYIVRICPGGRCYDVRFDDGDSRLNCPENEIFPVGPKIDYYGSAFENMGPDRTKLDGSAVYQQKWRIRSKKETLEKVLKKYESDDRTGFLDDRLPALLKAASEGDYESVASLIDSGVDVRGTSCDGYMYTALHYFADTTLVRNDSQYEMVSLLLNAPNGEALLNAQDNEGNTALHIAACMNHPKIVMKLLVSGADSRVRSHCGYTPMDWAVFKSNAKVIHLLSTFKQHGH